MQSHTPKDKSKYWFLIPKFILDKNKYSGKGRPKKTDYRLFPGPEDMYKPNWELGKVKYNKKKNEYDYKVKIYGNKYNHIIGSSGIA